MARTDSIDVFINDTSVKAKLKEEKLNTVIEAFELGALSQRTKNTNLSGTPTAGSFEVSRFMKSVVRDKGTARIAGKGDALEDNPVVVNIDKDKEIIEEVHQKDLDFYGIDGIIDKRGADHVVSMIDFMDSQFFATAVSGGTQYKPLSTLPNIKVQVQKAITKLSKTSNRYMKGVPRSRMFLAFDPDTYDELRDEIEKVHTPNVDTAAAEIFKFRGVECAETINLPEDVKFVLYVKDYSVAQPYKVNKYDTEKIPLDDAAALELFFYFGTKAVVSESILWFDGTTVDPENKSENKSANKSASKSKEK